MIDAILHIADTTAFSEDDPMPQGATKTNGNQALIYWRGKALPDGERITVLASRRYTGKGKAQRLFDHVQGNTGLTATYTSVHSIAPVTRTDEDGNEHTVTPPFAFGMLSEHPYSWEPTLEEMQQAAKQKLITAIDEFGDRVKAGTSATEREGWTLKAIASKELLAGGEAEAMLQIEADRKGITVEEIAQRVLAKAGDYAAITILCAVLRSDTSKAIDAAQSQVEIDAALHGAFERASAEADAMGIGFPHPTHQ